MEVSISLCYPGCTTAADLVAGGPSQVDGAAALPAAGSYDQSGQKSDDAPPIKRYTASSLFKRFKPAAKRSEDINVNKASTAGSDIHGTFASWEPCARAIETERKDFGEFIVCFPNLQLCDKPGLKVTFLQLCNLAFACAALLFITVRSRGTAFDRLGQLLLFVTAPARRVASAVAARHQATIS